MFFRREKPKILSFSQRIDMLRQAGFDTQNLANGRVRIAKNGAAAIVTDHVNGQTAIERDGVLVNGELGVLASGGYQMFLELPSGRRIPATADQLKALHEFEEDVKEALGLTSLYNTSLGTTSRKHVYDRVWERDTGHQPKPWEHKGAGSTAVESKGSVTS